MFDFSVADATKFSGVVAFQITAAACVFASSKVSRERRAWLVNALLFAVLALEVLLGYRYLLHGLLVQEAISTGDYGLRQTTQILILGLLLAGGAVASIIAVRRLRSTALRVTRVASLGAVLLFVAEVVSLHDWDAVMYRPVGGLMVIGWLWLLFAGIGLIGAVRGVRN